MSYYISGLNDQFHPGFKKDIIDLIEQMIQEDKKKPGDRTDETTTKQQILILHYLGVIKSINLDNTKKAVLLSKLLNRNTDNVRKYLTYVDGLKIEDSDIKTKNNLETVLNLFRKVDLEEQIKMINKDLEALDKIK